MLALARQVHAARADATAALAAALAGCLPQGSSLNLGEEAWQHRLGLAALLLEQLPPPRARGPPPPLAALPGGIAGLHAGVLAPALGHASPAVRAGAVRCVGLACLLGDPGAQPGGPALQPSARWLAQHGLPALRTGLLLDGHPGVAAAAAAALCDCALLWGPRALDRLATHPPDPAAAAQGFAGDPDEAAAAAAAAALPASSAPVLELLLGCLPALGGGAGPGRRSRSLGSGSGSDAAAGWRAVAEAAAEGLAKLLLGDARWARSAGADPALNPNPDGTSGGLEPAEASAALAALLASFHDTATEPAAATRQCLSVFFPVYAAGEGAGAGARRAALAAAALPAARRALAAAGAKPARSGAPQLLRYVLQLLQARPAIIFHGPFASRTNPISGEV